MIAVTVMRLALYRYVIRRPHLLWASESTRHTRQGYLLAASPLIVYLIAMGVAVASPTASVAIFFSVPVLYFGAATIARERGGANSEAEDFS